MYRIKKRFRFEAAHTLNSSYSKECQYTHGHSYRVDVYFTREDLNDDGMVEDFKLIKEELAPFMNRFDHATICNKATPGKHIMEIGANPTAENMAKFMFDYISNIHFSFEVKLDKIRVWETEDNYAEYYKTPIWQTTECACCAK